jgi:galactose-1-phosphate uridylyltransferase
MRIAVGIARRSYTNPAVQAVLIRKNQGRESGASQPHVHTQVIGSPEPFQPVKLEQAQLARESGLLKEILDFVDSHGFMIARENGCVFYFCPWGTFPSGYEILCPEVRERITEVPAEQLDAFTSLLHRALGTLGSLPLDFEIHDGPGVPLHAHLSLRRFPYSNMGGTLNLPSIDPAAFRFSRIGP